MGGGGLRGSSPALEILQGGLSPAEISQNLIVANPETLDVAKKDNIHT